MKLDEPQKLLTVKEVAQRLGQSRFTIYRKIERGELPAVRIGAGVQAPLRVDVAELDAFVYGQADE